MNLKKKEYVDSVEFNRREFRNAVENGITSIIKVVIERISETGNNIFEDNGNCDSSPLGWITRIIELNSVNHSEYENRENFEMVKLLIDSGFVFDVLRPLRTYISNGIFPGVEKYLNEYPSLVGNNNEIMTTLLKNPRFNCIIFDNLDKFMPFINFNNEIMTILLTNPRVNYMIFEKLDKFMPFINFDNEIMTTLLTNPRVYDF